LAAGAAGADGLLGAANRFAAAYSKGGAKVWGLGMVEAMNKGCRTHMKLDERLPHRSRNAQVAHSITLQCNLQHATCDTQHATRNTQQTAGEM
jgi:hypothetical protein